MIFRSKNLRERKNICIFAAILTFTIDKTLVILTV